MNLYNGLKKLSCIFIRRKENPRAEDEEGFYFNLPFAPLPKNFSHTDLGCGNKKSKATLFGYPNREANCGIDSTRINTKADLLCRLGLESLPLEDNSQDLITAYDVMEHIPKVCLGTENEKPVYVYPTINLFNEIYRVLKPGGYFESIVPAVPNYWNGVVRDPTHVSLYCIESFDYFCEGRFEALSKSYGLKQPFQKVIVHWRSSSHIQAVLRKPN